MKEFENSNTHIALACDHGGYSTKQRIIEYLKNKGIPYKDFGAYSDDSCDYPEYAHVLAQSIEKNEYLRGIAICGTGNGIAMTLNKHHGIRAALCWEKEIARLSRLHNDANVLVLPGRFLGVDDLKGILDVFLNTPFEGGRHENRIKKMIYKINNN